jgi:hypothetical protein
MFDIDFSHKGELKLHIQKFLLYPKHWIDQNNEISIRLEWNKIRFTEANIKHIPENQGLYAFTVEPKVTNFFKTSYLFYIGETERTLKIRYKEYLDDQKGKGKPRPKIFEMLKLYKDNLYFYYTEIDESGLIAENEVKLLNTFVPHINTQIPLAKINPELKYIYE